MVCNNNELRMVVREALEKGGVEALIMELSPMIENNQSEILDWMRFEEFGTSILSEIKYLGEYDEILYSVKAKLETQEGWHFDD